MQKWSFGVSVVVGLLLSSTAFAQQRPGTIVVNSGSAKGEIVLDGFPTGIMAPSTLESVPPGEHVIEVEYGCMFASGTVLVRTEEQSTANLKVENRGGEGTIRVRNLPRGAEVYIDDAPADSLGLEDGSSVKCGARRVRVESPGFEPWEELVVVTSGKWSTVTPELVEAEMVEEPRYEERDIGAYDEPEYGGYDDLDEPDDDFDIGDDYDLEPEEYEQKLRDEERRREEEARRRAEEERRRAEDERRRADEQARLDRFGDIDSLDEPDEPEETKGRTRDRQRDEEPDERDDAFGDDFDDLDEFGDEEDYDDGFDEFGDDYDDYDEDYDDIDAYDDLDDEPRERSSRDRTGRDKSKSDKSKSDKDRLKASSQKQRKPFPVRGAAVAGGVAVAGGGLGLAIAGNSQVKANIDNYNQLVANNPLDPNAINLNNTQIKPGKQKRGVGIALIGVGAGVAAASFAVIEPAWDQQIAVVPVEGGGMAVWTVEF